MPARPSYIAGFSATSNVLVGQRFKIPISGTMAHSFVQAHDDEISAFARFAEANPGNVVLLIDTYETEAAAEKVVRLPPKLKQLGIDIQGVRIDSGDLRLHARKVIGDVLTLGEDPQDGDPLLIPTLRSGKRLDPPKPLFALRERAAGQLGCLPDKLRTLDRAAPFEVKVAKALRSLALAVDEQTSAVVSSDRFDSKSWEEQT